MKPDVVITPCADYSEAETRRALEQALEPFDGLSWVKPGMRIAIKANLVSFLKPEKAATTHPALLCQLVKMFSECGADVVVGDSPGGLYNAAFVGRVYAATGMKAVTEAGGRLNQNFTEKDAEFPEAAVCKKFRYTAWLDEADAIIDFCKLKTHGMMAMTCGAKNMFGVIPGTMKPEYHFRYPDPRDFARMIVDLNEYFKPRLTIVDAVVCMEGNGPTGGTPRHMGALVAGENPHKVDLLCAKLIGLDRKEVPTLEAALERGLIPESVECLNVQGSAEDYHLADFKRIKTGNSHLFSGDGKSLRGKLTGAFLNRVLAQKPGLKPTGCVGCGVCHQICPVKAIEMIDGKPKIDRKKCIRCFCCQEFCPQSAMIVKRTLIAKLLEK